MKGKELLTLLLQQRGMNPNALATALNGATKQPQIQKFLAGTAAEPRRSTLAPIAKYFDVPLDAFYDEFLAAKIAYQRGLVGTCADSTGTGQPVRQQTCPTVQDAGPPIPFPSPGNANNLRDSLRCLRDSLAHETPGVRRSVVAILSDLADRADDTHFGNQMIERIMGALGQQGNAPQPESTSSPPNHNVGG